MSPLGEAFRRRLRMFPSNGTRTARGLTPGFGKSFRAAENIAASTRLSPTAVPSCPARAS